MRAKSCSVVPNCLQKFHNLVFDTPTRKTVSSAFNIHHKSLIFNHINSVLLHHNTKYPPPTYPPMHSYESPHYQISKKKIFLLFNFIFILNLKNKALRKPLHLYPCWQQRSVISFYHFAVVFCLFLALQYLISTKRSYILKQTCSFRLQVCLRMCDLLLDIRH